MNRTTDNTLSLSCGFGFLPINTARIPSDLQAAFIVRIIVNSISCPLIILLNILVMVAVKTKRQLRTKSNVALACLATTDLVMGLVVQPMVIASSALIFKGEAATFCDLTEISIIISRKCVSASFYHLLSMSAERYLAIKHTFIHENQVTEFRIIIASTLAWVAAILIPKEQPLMNEKNIWAITAVCVVMSILFTAMVYFNVAVYIEVRRSEKQIAANQVSLEAKVKILKNKKAFYTTTIVLLVISLCYIPSFIYGQIVVGVFEDSIPSNIRYIVFCLVTLLPILNSLFNPLIYAVRVRYFRVAVIQLLSRKTTTQAEELERKIFGPRQIRVIANVEQGQDRADQSEEDEQQVNETLNNGHVISVQTQSQEEYKDTPL